MEGNRPRGIGIDTIYNRLDEFTTRNGRPLYELNSSDVRLDVLRSQGIAFEQRPSPHKDSRGEVPDPTFNFSAFQEITREKQAMLDGFAWIHEVHLREESSDVVTVDQFKSLAYITQALPAYLALRAENPIPATELPNVVGSLFKAGVGFHMVAEELSYTSEEEEITPEAIFAIANEPKREAYSLLVDKKGVCAAPRQMILQASRALLYGQSGVASRSELGALIPEDEIDQFRKFYTVYGMYLDLDKKIKLAVEETAEHLGKLNEPAFMDALRRNEFERVKPTILILERLMNDALGRNPEELNE